MLSPLLTAASSSAALAAMAAFSASTASRLLSCSSTQEAAASSFREACCGGGQQVGSIQGGEGRQLGDGCTRRTGAGRERDGCTRWERDKCTRRERDGPVGKRGQDIRLGETWGEIYQQVAEGKGCEEGSPSSLPASSPHLPHLVLKPLELVGKCGHVPPERRPLGADLGQVALVGTDGLTAILDLW